MRATGDRDVGGDDLAEGVYESVLSHRLRASIAAARGFDHDVEPIDPADEPALFGAHVSTAIRRALSSQSDPHKRRALVNAVLEALEQPDEGVLASELLVRLSRPTIDRPPLEAVRPATPLSETALLTNARGEPQLGHELRAELASADRVDLLCAFVKWHGIRVLEDSLRALRDRGVRLRVITTTYMGATEVAALERLVNEFGAEVRVHYEQRSTRLHAKAWLFRRDSGFDTAYVGSSNLSRSALLEGLEWNVRLSTVANADAVAKFRATFESYWADPAYEPFDPERDRDRLTAAIDHAAGRSSSGHSVISLSGLEVRPYPHQSEILEALEAEREVHGRHRNLVVAATGTGKTVVAALDYRRIRARQPTEDPRLLFVAHRGEILEQSLRTYREVLGDGAFGEAFHSGRRPRAWRHVFATVQSLAGLNLDAIGRNHFDAIVIDEFHHAEASTYRRLLDHFSPRELLGLTATPERHDGVDVREFFDGRTAYELRLWDALDADLLVPFHYFGIADGTDLSRVEWKRGRYDATSLSTLFTGNDARARIVVNELKRRVADVHDMRAIGFCVSVAHATYMSEVFNRAGIRATAVTGATDVEARAGVFRDLVARRISIIFTVGVMNEGVDLPAVDTVLFLRPTESATLFIQQLGRGLRRSPGKPVLTALDFVGHQRQEFRFDRRLRAMTGLSRKKLLRAAEHDFPLLPSGSQIMLDRVVQREVVDGLRRQFSLSKRELVSEIRNAPHLSLAGFLDEHELELADVLRSSSPARTWTTLRRDAGVDVPAPGPRESALLRRVRALAHVDDADRATAYVELLRNPTSRDVGAPFVDMLFFSLWPDGGGFDSPADGLASLLDEPAVRAELADVVRIGADATRHRPIAGSGSLSGLPLRPHASYQREEILAALEYASMQRKPNSFREGVLFAERYNADALFITLTKSEAEFSPSTRYRDYAISRDLVHWESQSRTTTASATGQRYLTHRERGSQILLFARDRTTNDLGTSPFMFLGSANYVSHRGERPIAITWKLDIPMPTDVFLAARAVAS